MQKLFAVTVIGAVLVVATACALVPVRTMQGMVDRVDPERRTLTLVGGMTFTIPANISVGLLAPGYQVTVNYRDGTDGQKELAAFWIDAGVGEESKD
jgi:heme/copper-type cytochrome/quinol oxidase subunit 2